MTWQARQMAAPPRWLQRQLAAAAAAGADVSRLRAGGPPGAPADRFCASIPFCGSAVACAPRRQRDMQHKALTRI